MTSQQVSTLFKAASLFNILAALGLVFATEFCFVLLELGPLPNQSVFLHLFASLVFTFGIAYYFVSIDLDKYYLFIYLGMLGKTLVILVFLVDWITGITVWGILIPGTGDLLFTVFFGYVIKNREMIRQH